MHEQLAIAREQIAEQQRSAEIQRQIAEANAVRARADEDLQKQRDLELIRNAAKDNPVMITTVFGFLTLVAGFCWKAFIDARDHRWVAEAANKLAQETAENHVVLMRNIEGVSKSASAAFAEANNSNVKIAELQRTQMEANENLKAQNTVAGRTTAEQLSRMEEKGAQTAAALGEHDAWERERAAITDART